MKQRRVHVEHLLGRTVHDADGRKAGRLEEIEVEETSRGCFVTKFVLGPRGLLTRLSFSGIGPLFFPSLGDKRRTRLKKVPWEQMDLSNPRRPRLRCRKDEL
jgi:sporulation protein YlmC with PRC-barrel domain